MSMLVRATAAMFGVPALVMLLAHWFVLDQLFTFRSAADKMLYAGIAGLCAVQLVVVGFLIHAFTEKDDEPPSSNAKKSD